MWKKIARAGWVARGVSYSAAGLITLSLVRGSSAGSEDADQQGALRAIADTSIGPILLVALALGLALFSFWQAAQFLQLDGTEFDTWLERVAKVIGVFFYGSLAFTAARLVVSSADTSGGGRWSVERAISWALQNPAGRVAIAIAALIVTAVALRRGARTFTGDLDDDLNFEKASDTERRLIELLGRTGEIGRALSFLIIAWFLIRAAWTGASAEAGGLSKSLVSATDSMIGAVLVVVAGLGFIVFGLYSIFSSRHRRLDFADAT